MSRRLVHRLAPALVIFPLVLGFLPQLTLCVGPGGHHAIELVNADCCLQAFATAAAEPGQLAKADCTQECTDTPVGSGPVITGGDRAHRDAPLVPLLSVPGSVTGPLLKWTTVGPSSPVAAPSEPPPRSLRTAVNLC